MKKLLILLAACLASHACHAQLQAHFEESIICLDGSESISITPIVEGATNLSYLWQPNGESSASIIVSEAGTYSVLITNLDNPDQTATVSIEADEKPNFFLYAPDTNCADNFALCPYETFSLQLEVWNEQAGFEYHHYSESGVLLGTGISFTTFGSSTGYGPLQVKTEAISPNGCVFESWLDANVLVEPLPSALDGAHFDYLEGSCQELNFGGNSPEDFALSGPDMSNILPEPQNGIAKLCPVKASHSGTYHLSVATADAECVNCFNSGTFTINVIPDVDTDGIANTLDNCPDYFNPNQVDADGDGVGDDCDNCPTAANTDQADLNENGIGDACEFTSVEPSRYTKISIGPNPCHGLLQLEFDHEIERDAMLSLYNNLGQQVLISPLKSQIDMSHLPSGLYLVLLKHKEQIFYREKLIIEH